MRAILVCLALFATVSQRAAAYDVESDSTGNTIYLLLWNTHPSADFTSISISEDLPAFIPLATASILPASVPAAASDLAAVEFDVAAAASIGATGSITVTVSGSSSGQAIDVILEVPLEVVATAAEAQGVVGVGVPAPDPGGVDSDGDGVSDALEIAFGSDPNDASSTPGESPPVVPALEVLGLWALAALLLLGGSWLVGHRLPTVRRS